MLRIFDFMDASWPLASGCTDLLASRWPAMKLCNVVISAITSVAVDMIGAAAKSTMCNYTGFDYKTGYI
jgi:hypothetical protein